MPCGGAMAFRKVVIPSLGPLERPAHHAWAAPTRARLRREPPGPPTSPAASAIRRASAITSSASTRSASSSTARWPGPAPSADANARMPQVDVGWIDAVTFADRYSLWLRTNAADRLPTGRERDRASSPADRGRVGVRRARRHPGLGVRVPRAGLPDAGRRAPGLRLVRRNGLLQQQDPADRAAEDQPPRRFTTSSATSTK